MEFLEICWATESFLYVTVYILMMGYVLCRFAKPFMVNQDKSFGIGTAYFFTMFILYVMPFKLRNVVAYGIGTLSAFLVMCMVDYRNCRQKIFITVMFFSLRWLSSYMASMITVKLVDPIIYTTYMAERPVRQFIAAVAIDILNMLITFTVIGISVRYIVKAYIYSLMLCLRYSQRHGAQLITHINLLDPVILFPMMQSTHGLRNTKVVELGSCSRRRIYCKRSAYRRV